VPRAYAEKDTAEKDTAEKDTAEKDTAEKDTAAGRRLVKGTAVKGFVAGRRLVSPRVATDSAERQRPRPSLPVAGGPTRRRTGPVTIGGCPVPARSRCQVPPVPRRFLDAPLRRRGQRPSPVGTPRRVRGSWRGCG
jgi:hypothetical protein